MATFNKFNSFVTAVAAGTHAGFLNADTDVVKVYLSNAAPSQSLDAVKTDLAEITNQNGYTAPVDVTGVWTESGGTATLAGTDITITATGTVGPFQYAVLYNDTPTSPADPLIGYWDYGSAITLANGETFTVDFGASILTLA
jgi:hypothetical protein